MLLDTCQCEDLLFLHAHVERGGSLHRAGGEAPLVIYRYHAAAATHAIPRRTILRHRAAAIEASVLRDWPSFTIWGAGRDGREFFKALAPETRRRVAAFCDVDGGHLSRRHSATSDLWAAGTFHRSTQKRLAARISTRARTWTNLDARPLGEVD